MTKKSKSKNSRSNRSNRLSGKISNLNRRPKTKHTRKFIPNNLDLDPIPENATPLGLDPTIIPTPLKIYRGKSKKVFTRNSWGVPIAYITSTSQQMRETGVDQRHLKEELEYTRLLHKKFPFILNAEDITQNNEARVGESSEINHNSSTLSRIFVYKKERVDHVHGDSPGILEFIAQCIYTMANSELAFVNGEAEYFTYLDMKPENIGIKSEIIDTELKETFVILDNGPDLCYIIPKEFISYFQEAAIIIGVVNLKRRLTTLELEYLRTLGLTSKLITAAFHKRLYNAEKREIIKKSVKYYQDNHMPLTAETMKTDLIFPREVINHYCRIKEELGIEHRRERIREIMNFTQLAEL